jgi:hypothetical protein
MPYLCYKLVPGENNRTEKLPVSPLTGGVVNAHNPEYWVPKAQAALAAALFGPPYGVAYVLPPERTHWAIDIDNAFHNGEWSKTAVDLCRRFAGCYIEVSQSGRGLHIIGKGELPPHSIKSKTLLGVDLFSCKRAIALTGTDASGDMDAEAPEILALAAEHFPPRADGGGQADHTGWTDTPCEEWAGPEDDDELLKLAMTRQSPSAAFGGKASFRALWEGDEAVLGKFFPETGTQNRAYDASSADSALACHLVYWTGRDCDRIRRLMERSALVRQKWLREDYIPRTVLKACALVTEVYASGAVTVIPPTDGATTADIARGQVVGANDYSKYFAGCVWIEELERIAVPDGNLLTKTQFDANSRYGGNIFVLDHQGKTTRSAWDGFNHNVFAPHLRADGICFRPELPARCAVTVGKRTLYNTYVPDETPAVPGDVTPMLRHLDKMFRTDRDREIALCTHAAIVQHPGVKFQWALVIQGCEGNGKSLLTEAAMYCVGEKYSHTVASNDIANKFNGWVPGTLLAVVEELAVRDRVDMIDVLKVLITNLRIEIQRKGENQYMGDNRANFLINTNHKDALPKTLDDRRYCIIHCEQQEAAHLVRDGMDGTYFPELYRWARGNNGFAYWNHYLRNYRIPGHLNPATDCHRAPLTSSTAAAIEASLGPVEQAILEAIASDEIGFRGGFVSSHWLGMMLDQRRMRGKAPPAKWDAVMKAIGYIRHPNLIEGRVNNTVAPDGRRPRLWVRPGSLASAIPTAAEVAAAYSKANGV